MPDTVTMVAVCPVKPFSSSSIRIGAALLLPLVVWIATALGLGKKYGIDFSNLSVNDLVSVFDVTKDTVIAVGTAYAGIKIIVKRIRQGQNPLDPAPPIQAPAVVDAVKRITNG
jgi:hypothetical protein